MTKDGRAEIQCAMIALNRRRTSKKQVQRTAKCTHLVPETVFKNPSVTEKNVGKTLNPFGPAQARVRPNTRSPRR